MENILGTLTCRGGAPGFPDGRWKYDCEDRAATLAPPVTGTLCAECYGMFVRPSTQRTCVPVSQCNGREIVSKYSVLDCEGSNALPQGAWQNDCIVHSSTFLEGILCSFCRPKGIALGTSRRVIGFTQVVCLSYVLFSNLLSVLSQCQ